MAGGLGGQWLRRRGGNLPAGVRGAGHRRRGRACEQHHRRAPRPRQRQPARRGEIEQRLAPVQLDQHCRGGRGPHAVEPRAQQRLAVFEHEQRQGVGVQPHPGQSGAIRNARGVLLPRPDQRAPVQLAPQPRDEQRETHRSGAVDRLGRQELVQPVGAQPAVQRQVEPRRAQGHRPHGRGRRRQHRGKRRIGSHMFMICSFLGGVRSYRQKVT